MATEEKNRMFNYFCNDIQVRGEYPSNALAYFENNGIEIDRTEEELAIIKAYTVDYLSFSYYMSATVSVKTEHQDDKSQGNFFGGVKNPFLKASEWGWEIDPVGLRLALCDLY
ncbi:glycoside hydrolase family 1 protein, partial [Acinetobacter baumannii]|nr:glycoside hydrolase family 1 protein [Acinetobacter baumannii]